MGKGLAKTTGLGDDPIGVGNFGLAIQPPADGTNFGLAVFEHHHRVEEN